jgi:hypothetical protein
VATCRRGWCMWPPAYRGRVHMPTAYGSHVHVATCIWRQGRCDHLKMELGSIRSPVDAGRVHMSTCRRRWCAHSHLKTKAVYVATCRWRLCVLDPADEGSLQYVATYRQSRCMCHMQKEARCMWPVATCRHRQGACGHLQTEVRCMWPSADGGGHLEAEIRWLWPPV